jgi:hypothetical protein
VASVPVPLACSLDSAGLREQGERYRRIGSGARVVERGARRLVVELPEGVAAEDVEGAIAVERECCPFFAMEWEPGVSRLSIGVARTEDEPALAVVVFALGLEEERG